MIPQQLNQLVEERRQKCEEKSLYIDTFQKKAKGYCKARDVLAFPQKECHNNITQPTSDMSSPSGVFDSTLSTISFKIFNKYSFKYILIGCGVDYVG